MAKTIITISFCIGMFLRIFPIDLTTGGDNFLYAQVDRERFIYELVIENNASKVLTKMRVYAHDETDARNQTELNGWTIIDIKTYVPKDDVSSKNPNKKEILLRDNPADDKTPADVTIDSPLAPERMFDELDKKRTPKNDYVPDFFGNDNISALATSPDNSSKTNDNKTANKDNQSDNESIGKSSGRFAAYSDNDLLPGSAKLELITTIYFDLGEIRPRNDIVGKKLEELDTRAIYVVMGHADEVNVGMNAVYKNNFELSYMRANYIRDMLEKKGHKKDDMKTLGLGVRYPIVEDVKGGNKLNRRVEIYGFRSNE